jgi:hypothetical protein
MNQIPREMSRQEFVDLIDQTQGMTNISISEPL